MLVLFVSIPDGLEEGEGCLSSLGQQNLFTALLAEELFQELIAK